MNAPGGSVPTPNWEALAAATGGAPTATRAQVVPQILSRLVTEASTSDIAGVSSTLLSLTTLSWQAMCLTCPFLLAVHDRRVCALKALVCTPQSIDSAFDALVKIIFLILDKVMEERKQRRKRTLFGRGAATGRQEAVQANRYYAALSALRRLPLDSPADLLIQRVVIGWARPLTTCHLA